jgi:hypothetical protein
VLKQSSVDKPIPPKARFNKLSSPAKANKSVTQNDKSNKLIKSRGTPGSKNARVTSKINNKPPVKPAAKPPTIIEKKKDVVVKPVALQNDEIIEDKIVEDKIEESPPKNVEKTSESEVKKVNEIPVDEKYESEFSSKKNLKEASDVKQPKQASEKVLSAQKSPEDPYSDVYDSFGSAGKDEPVKQESEKAINIAPKQDDDNKSEAEIKDDVYSLPSEPDAKKSPQPVINPKSDAVDGKKAKEDDIDDYIEDDFEFE